MTVRHWSTVHLTKSQTVDQLAAHLNTLSKSGFGNCEIPWEALIKVENFDLHGLRIPIEFTKESQ